MASLMINKNYYNGKVGTFTLTDSDGVFTRLRGYINPKIAELHSVPTMNLMLYTSWLQVYRKTQKIKQLQNEKI